MNLSEIIRIIREVALIIVVILLGYRIVNSEFSINLGTLSVTDIVALLLAFFAIGLSAAFYFKSSDSSNQFYDNMHKFTQETSVLLGKIESKFGEQLKNIEQKSQDLKESVDRYYSSNSSGASEDIAKEKAATEKQVSESEQEFEKIIETLFEKSKLDETEKQGLKVALKEKENELKRLQSELNKISNEEKATFERRVERHLTRILTREVKDKDNDHLTPMEVFAKILQSSNRMFLKDLYEKGYIKNRTPEAPADITENGEKLFMSILEKVLS
ncbi:hypothetical protein QDG88_15150 [Pseudoalteromonas piscicida]|uniref:hypothetical protein n=1 Tax=Pseudoalteromonas piscicida TaxID=43662 RepID=UPI002738D433|nr:hypothetical protein [Pseudoalteromonas piscicida]MDP4489261.1 hypothetical protein [Pseudoalteromonas piscicida]